MSLSDEPVNEAAVRLAVRTLLLAVGEDPDRDGLRETPERYFRFMREWFCPPPVKWTTFDAEGSDSMIVQRGISFYSFCEHHLCPFHGRAVVAYIPDGRIVGLSKLARAVDVCARGLQNQERITRRVADVIEEQLRPKGVAVLLSAEHLCMSMRGARQPGAQTVTNELRGAFRDDARCRAEFMALAGAPAANV